MSVQPFAQQGHPSLDGFTIQYPAYRGEDPYVFISYAHVNSDKVYTEIARLNEMGVNVWYDEGIAPGNEWNEDIARALSGCALFVVMMTNNAAQSQNVRNEINYAIDEKKPFIAIHLEETDLNGGLKLQIGSMQAILKYLMSDAEYVRRLSNALVQRGISIDDAYMPLVKERNPSSTSVAGYQHQNEPTQMDPQSSTTGGLPFVININSFNNSINNNSNNTNVGVGYSASPKSRMLALLLCIFLGYFGVHQFYAGRIGRGLIYLFTVGLFGFGWIWDTIQIIRGRFTDSYGMVILN